MDPRTSAQHVIHCDTCETVKVQMHCDTCLVILCKACVGEHISTDVSKDHKVVKYELRNSTPLYPECASHGKERCEMFCRNCDISVCGSCLSSDRHMSHKLSKVVEVLDEKKDKINKYKSELNENVNPKYLEMESNIQNKISELEKEYEKLLTSITKQGEVLQGKINKLVNQLKNQVNEMKRSQLQTLKKILDEINKKIINIRDEINVLDIAKDSNDFSKIFSLQVSIEQHKNFPKIPILSAPNFTPKVIQEDELCSHFGNFSSIPLKSKQFGNIPETPKEISLKSHKKSPPHSVKQGSVKVSLPYKKLRNEPEIFDKRIYHYGRLRNIACLGDEKIWACDECCTMTLYSINQGLIKSIRTRTINRSPTDIAVTRGGELV
ncbi:E3 ubiquitin-protein ligase TRIM33-like [Saccostrea cucullata]|uniref:E3 ubiquitin-protein ligase TRIM33-like n=1 Tax=Saccostrea cuccullata TaxID=36930 RepID=UPI002ED5CF99